MEAASERSDESKFAHLVKDADDDESVELDDEGGEDEGAEPAKKSAGGTYDLGACANDMMAAFQSGDVAALEEALSELLDKKK